MDQIPRTHANTPPPTDDPRVAAALDQHVFSGIFEPSRLKRMIEQVIVGLIVAFLIGGIAFFMRDSEATPEMCYRPVEQEQATDLEPKPEPEKTKKALIDVYDI